VVWFGRRLLQCAGRGRHRKPSDRDARGHEYRSDRSQLANVAREAKAVLQVDTLEAVADRVYFNGEEILACEQADICVTLPKPMTSGAKKLEGRFGKRDFVYLPDEDVRLSLPSRAAAEVLLRRRLNGGKRGRGTGTDH
jgi:hypothetical protein